MGPLNIDAGDAFVLVAGLWPFVRGASLGATLRSDGCGWRWRPIGWDRPNSTITIAATASLTAFAGRVFAFRHGLFAQMTGVEKVICFDCRLMGRASQRAGAFCNLIWWDRRPERSC